MDELWLNSSNTDRVKTRAGCQPHPGSDVAMEIEAGRSCSEVRRGAGLTRMRSIGSELGRHDVESVREIDLTAPKSVQAPTLISLMGFVLYRTTPL
jgi:hypothetical protein